MFVINICERPLFKESYTTPDGSCNNIYILFGKGKRKVMTVQNHSEHTGGGKNCRLNWPETRAPHPFERCKSPKRTCQNIQQTNENLKAQVIYIHMFLKFGHVPHTHWIQTKTNIDESSQSWSARSGSAPLLVSCLGWIFGFIVSRKSKGTLQCTPLEIRPCSGTMWWLIMPCFVGGERHWGGGLWLRVPDPQSHLPGGIYPRASFGILILIPHLLTIFVSCWG